jgi:hypothetical protein
VTFGADISGSGAEAVSIASRTGGTVTVSGVITSGGAATGVSVADNTGGTDITFSGAGTTISSGTFAGIALSGNGSATVNFTGGGLDVNTTAGNGVDVSGSGTLNIGGPGNSITSGSGTTFRIGGEGNTIAVDCNADLTGGTGGLVDIQNHSFGNITFSGNLNNTGAGASGILITKNTSGTVTFSGPSKTLSTGDNTAVSLSNNGDMFIDFTGGGLAVATDAGDGFYAGGGGTVITVQGPNNTISTGTGEALEVTNMFIGAASLTFRSISAGTAGAGPDNGIHLENTGLSGGLTVTGDGYTAASGGTIRNTSFEGVFIQGAANVNLNYLKIQNTGFDSAGIHAEGIDGFSISHGDISNTDCDGLQFESSVSGDINISNTTVSNAYMYGLYANVISGTANWTISGCTIETPGCDGMGFVGDLDGSVMIQNTTVSGASLNGLFAYATGGTANWTISGCTFELPAFDAMVFVGAINGSVSITNTTVTGLSMSGLYAAMTAGTADWTISGCTIESSGCDAVSFSGAIDGSISMSDTTITGSGMAGVAVIPDSGSSTFDMTRCTVEDSQFDGIRIDLAGSAVMTSTISGCTVVNSNLSNLYGGYYAGVTLLSAGTSTLTATVKDLSSFSGNTRGIYALATDDGNMTVTISGNVFTDHTEGAIKISQRATNTTAGSLKARVQDNSIGTPGAPNSGSLDGSGVNVTIDGNNPTASAAVAIVNNTISEVASNNAILVQSVSEIDSSTLDVTINGNTVLAPTLGSPASPIFFECDDGDTLHADIQNNTTFVPGTVGGSGAAYELFATAASTFTLFQTSPANATALAQLQATNAPTTPISITGTVTLTTTPVALPPQLALGGQRYGGVGVPTVTTDQLATILVEAEDRWAALGISAADLARLHGVTAVVADLPDGYLGAAPLYGNTIYVDVTAAGYGWFVDPTPADDSEFGLGAADGTAAGRMDLLTVVMHELGHVLGLDSKYDGDPSDLMYAYLGTGDRRLPSMADVEAIEPSAAESTGDSVVAGIRSRERGLMPAATNQASESVVTLDEPTRPKTVAEAPHAGSRAENAVNWWDVAPQLRRAKRREFSIDLEWSTAE